MGKEGTLTFPGSPEAANERGIPMGLLDARARSIGGSMIRETMSRIALGVRASRSTPCRTACNDESMHREYSAHDDKSD